MADEIWRAVFTVEAEDIFAPTTRLRNNLQAYDCDYILLLCFYSPIDTVLQLRFFLFFLVIRILQQLGENYFLKTVSFTSTNGKFSPVAVEMQLFIDKEVYKFSIIH